MCVWQYKMTAVGNVDYGSFLFGILGFETP